MEGIIIIMPTNHTIILALALDWWQLSQMSCEHHANTLVQCQDSASSTQYYLFPADFFFTFCHFPISIIVLSYAISR